MKPIRQFATFASALLTISGCVAQKPVLSSNAHLMSVGSTVAERDVDECIAYAEAGAEAGPIKESPKETPVATAATSSVAGAAAGGASGAIFGNAGQGAAAGAV